MSPDGYDFRRLFAVNLYKNKSFLLGRMCFDRDFVHDDRGDPYPILAGTGIEEIARGTYAVQAEHLTRLLGGFSPYATYKMTLNALQGEIGFSFLHPQARASVFVRQGETLSVCMRENGKTQTVKTAVVFCPGMTFSVVPHKQWFDVFLSENGHDTCVAVFCSDAFASSDAQVFFESTAVGVTVQGSAELQDVWFCMDCGMAQADWRPLRYEDGTVMVWEGKIYLTASIRLQEECYQGVFAWVPGTAEFTLTGALFFDCGDGLWGNEVASSILFDRRTNEWLLWVCDFSHGHILGHARFDGDPRFGKNVIDITLMPSMNGHDPDEAYAAKAGDEDPDFVFDPETDQWMMAICRISRENNKYRYFFFASDDPFTGYTCIGKGIPGAETGGSFVKTDKRYFVCGNDFSARSDYRVYDFCDLLHPQKLHCDHPDGGFRGWGTLIPFSAAGRQKLFWLTFDRQNASDFNWSYGNLYCFEGKQSR